MEQEQEWLKREQEREKCKRTISNLDLNSGGDVSMRKVQVKIRCKPLPTTHPTITSEVNNASDTTKNLRLFPM
jgi:hypothetical protein